MSINSIIETVRVYKCRLVEITGGEPLFQMEVYPLMKQLCDEGFEVLLETSGSLDISNVDPRVKRVIDFKCPSSGMERKNVWENVHNLKSGDEVKFVIGDRKDYEWAKSVIQRNNLSNRCTVLMAVVLDVLDPKKLVSWILEDKLVVRFQLQVQKYIWKPETRGV